MLVCHLVERSITIVWTQYLFSLSLSFLMHENVMIHPSSLPFSKKNLSWFKYPILLYATSVIWRGEDPYIQEYLNHYGQ